MGTNGFSIQLGSIKCNSYTFYIFVFTYKIYHRLKLVIWKIPWFVLLKVLFCMKTRVSILSILIRIMNWSSNLDIHVDILGWYGKIWLVLLHVELLKPTQNPNLKPILFFLWLHRCMFTRKLEMNKNVVVWSYMYAYVILLSIVEILKP